MKRPVRGIVLGMLGVAGALHLGGFTSAMLSWWGNAAGEPVVSCAVPAREHARPTRRQTTSDYRPECSATGDSAASDTDLGAQPEPADPLRAPMSNDPLSARPDGAPGDTDAAEPRELLVRQWAELDPSAAASWALSLSEATPANRAAIEQVAVAWAEKDLSQAGDWVRNLPETENKTAAAVAVGYEAARTDPLLALELGRNLAPSTARDALLIHAARQWAASDLGSAAAWAVAVEPEDLRQHLTAAIAVAGAEQNPLAAATLLARDVAPGELQSSAAIAVAQRWAQLSPAAAADWVSRFADATVREAAFEDLFSIWRSLDSGPAEK